MTKGEASVGWGLSRAQITVKRLFDLCFSIFALLVSSWLILLAWLVASWDTRSNGFFVQERVGRHGKLFRVYKIKTMRPRRAIGSSVTYAGDPRVTKFGRFLRRTKIDELPQLWNILVGDMSFVGPRPDVPGFADCLTGDDRVVLSVRPGITGPATLKYRNEEEILAAQADPEAYNRDVIFPDKVRINREYIENWCLVDDLRYILRTVLR